jgi:hypothetical protein
LDHFLSLFFEKNEYLNLFVCFLLFIVRISGHPASQAKGEAGAHSFGHCHRGSDVQAPQVAFLLEKIRPESKLSYLFAQFYF